MVRLSRVFMITLSLFMLLGDTVIAQKRYPGRVIGEVTEWVGDFMPRIIDPNSAGHKPNRGKRLPLRTKVWVIEGKVKAEGSPSIAFDKVERVVKQVRTNHRGVYRVTLNPGLYTIMVEYNGRLYSNCMHGDGTFCSVDVEPLKTKRHDIRVTERATF